MTAEPVATALWRTENTLRIVQALKERRGARVTELASGLGLSKRTVHDHLSTLRATAPWSRSGTDTTGNSGSSRAARESDGRSTGARPEIQTLAEEPGELAN